MRYLAIASLVIAAYVQLGGAHGIEPAPSIQSQRLSFQQQLEDSNNHTAELGLPFDRKTIATAFYSLPLHQAQAQLNHIESLEELQALFNLAWEFHFYFQSASSAHRVRSWGVRYLEQLRAQVRAGHDAAQVSAEEPEAVAQKIYDSLIEMRQIASAAQFAASYSVPQTIDITQDISQESTETSSAPLRLILTEAQPNQFHLTTAEPIDISTPVVLASVSPACGFSMRALRWMAQNQSTEGAKSNIHFVVSSQDLRQMADHIARWNRDNEALRMLISSGTEGWPKGVWFGQTPVFYFVEDGRVVDQITGWASEAQGPELMARVQAFLSD